MEDLVSNQWSIINLMQLNKGFYLVKLITNK
jgi:hypothetical protein